MTNKLQRRIGYTLLWVVMFLVIFAVQTSHQLQLNSRAIWMKQVNEKLKAHSEKLDELTEAINELPEAMLKRFRDIQ